MKTPVNSEKDLNKLLAEKKERLKELSCINRTTQIIKEGKSIEETLHQICLILPAAWQYPESTVARIIFDNQEYKTARFRETSWKQSQTFDTIDNKKGTIEIFYLEKFNELDEGPFLREERHLIDNLASIIANYINSVAAKNILKDTLQKDTIKPEISEFKTPVVNSRQLLQKFLNKQNSNRDIFHDLMPFKVKEILLVATLYDAFSIEKEGRFSEHILGEYHQLNLTSMPRVTGVSSYDEAVGQLRSKHYDLVILMMGSDKVTPIEISSKVKDAFPYIPIYLLLNNNRDVTEFQEKNKGLTTIDKLFVWNGDSKVFFAMVKLLEDRVNVENDTKIGLVKVILLVEDSEKYYSRYLPMLYTSVMEQTQRIIEDVSTDELFKVLRLRARPKILLAATYEEAMEIFNKYRDNLLCLITDVKFKRNDEQDEEAGFHLVQQIRALMSGLPTIIQSSDTENAHKAYELQATFIDKNSESLLQDVKGFISHHLGFGNFVYRDAMGKKIATAKSMKEFENFIGSIPAESLVYHGKRNHFSLWLMARGEIKIAKMINPVKVSDFKNPTEFRNYLKFMIKKYRNESNTGKIVNFEESAVQDESNIVSLATGALGGKGRGIAFINTLVYNLNFSEIVPMINIRTPKTSIIGTDEFDIFLESNNLHDLVYNGDADYTNIQKSFLKSELSYHLMKKLKALIGLINKPIAIRSSSLFEDSTSQPFSGIFETYLLPNNHPDPKIRLKQVTQAIKLVYASIFSTQARNYFEAINYKIEEEKMAVVIQEVVGNEYDQYFYPHISGTAQSHNYYPIAHMAPEDGFSVIAVGLGQYVVNGEKGHRFSPRYPTIEHVSPKDQFKNSQVEFFAIDMQKKNSNLFYEGEDAGLIRLNLEVAEKHGTLKHAASVYDPENDRTEPGLSKSGPRIVNFANILKYNHIPLARTIEVILDVMKEALGAPVEIEFAVDLTKDKNGFPSFYMLQMKPLLGSAQDYHIDATEINPENVILRSEKSMGNGKIDDICDIIYIDKELFDKGHTRDMAEEIQMLNQKMIGEKRKYILIGPGRWGSRDNYLGIPVNWTQISNARIIVETSLRDYPLDASLGSHFFHNVTSMNVGYLSVQHASGSEFVDWSKIEGQKLIDKTKFCRHIRFQEPLTILMDGRQQISMILSHTDEKVRVEKE
ncbi:MAG TPA: PEP/pyruvate-binding domain-containing protein [Bacteroidales bacterium]|nr:PEP/pyruvate-binding domain-containing protein [Bacteroidales bacterium]